MLIKLKESGHNLRIRDQIGVSLELSALVISSQFFCRGTKLGMHMCFDTSYCVLYIIKIIWDSSKLTLTIY